MNYQLMTPTQLPVTRFGKSPVVQGGYLKAVGQEWIAANAPSLLVYGLEYQIVGGREVELPTPIGDLHHTAPLDLPENIGVCLSDAIALTAGGSGTVRIKVKVDENSMANSCERDPELTKEGIRVAYELVERVELDASDVVRQLLGKEVNTRGLVVDESQEMRNGVVMDVYTLPQFYVEVVVPVNGGTISVQSTDKL